MADLAQAPFNYGCLEQSEIETLQKTAARIRKKGHDTFLDIGRELLKVKDLLAHGLFTNWVESECQIGIRTAQRAMAAAQAVIKNDKLSLLPIDALVLLGKTEVPSEVTAALDDDRIPTVEQVKKLLRTGTTRNGKSPREKIEAAVKAMTEDEVHELCEWLKKYEAERFRQKSGVEPPPPTEGVEEEATEATA